MHSKTAELLLPSLKKLVGLYRAQGERTRRSGAIGFVSTWKQASAATAEADDSGTQRAVQRARIRLVGYGAADGTTSSDRGRGDERRKQEDSRVYGGNVKPDLNNCMPSHPSHRHRSIISHRLLSRNISDNIGSIHHVPMVCTCTTSSRPGRMEEHPCARPSRLPQYPARSLIRFLINTDGEHAKQHMNVPGSESQL
jgi:hypothetical protein